MTFKLSPVPHANVWDSTTQTYSGSTSGQDVFLNSIDAAAIESGIQIIDGYKIQFTNPGHYEMVFSAIVSQSTGTNVDYDIWFQNDGVDVPWSNTSVLVKDSGVATLMTVGIIGYSDGTNYAGLRWYSSSANGRLLSTVAGTSPTRPGVPSVLITIKKVSD